MAIHGASAPGQNPAYRPSALISRLISESPGFLWEIAGFAADRGLRKADMRTLIEHYLCSLVGETQDLLFLDFGGYFSIRRLSFSLFSHEIP